MKFNQIIRLEKAKLNAALKTNVCYRFVRKFKPSINTIYDIINQREVYLCVSFITI